MKILLVHDYGVLAGGAERITVDLRDGLRARGHDVRIFASTARPIALPSIADDTCYGTNGWPQRVLQVANPFAAHRLRRVLRAFRPDVVHVRMFLSQLSPLILPLLATVPSLLHAGSHQTLCPLNTRQLPDGSPCGVRAGAACFREGCVSVAGLARTTLQFSAWRRHQGVFRAVVANSEALAAAMRANDVPVTAVVRNGTRACSSRPPLGAPPTVAFAGRLVEQKGVDVLLESMAVVCHRLPDARLVIAGDGPDRARIEGLIRHWSLGSHVTMCGHVPRPALDDLLQVAWVQAVPSRYPEPSANVIPEAMMRGTAVIGTNVGGTPELIRDGVTGFLVSPRDPHDLTRRLLCLLEDRDLSERQGQAARAVALADLTTERMVDRFEAVYAGLRA